MAEHSVENDIQRTGGRPTKETSKIFQVLSLIPCGSCKKPVSVETNVCPWCGKDQPFQFRGRSRILLRKLRAFVSSAFQKTREKAALPVRAVARAVAPKGYEGKIEFLLGLSFCVGVGLFAVYLLFYLFFSHHLGDLSRPLEGQNDVEFLAGP